MSKHLEGGTDQDSCTWFPGPWYPHLSNSIHGGEVDR